jgi:hypothetical protein
MQVSLVEGFEVIYRIGSLPEAPTEPEATLTRATQERRRLARSCTVTLHPRSGATFVKPTILRRVEWQEISLGSPDFWLPLRHAPRMHSGMPRTRRSVHQRDGAWKVIRATSAVAENL